MDNCRINIRADQPLIDSFRNFKHKAGVKTDRDALHLLLKQIRAEGDPGMRWIKCEAEKENISDELVKQLKETNAQLVRAKKAAAHAQGKLGSFTRMVRSQVPAGVLAKIDFRKFAITATTEAALTESDDFFERIKGAN